MGWRDCLYSEYYTGIDGKVEHKRTDTNIPLDLKWPGDQFEWAMFDKKTRRCVRRSLEVDKGYQLWEPNSVYACGISVPSEKAEQTVLQEATEIVSGARIRAYGHPSQNHGNTATLWRAYLERRFGQDLPLNARDVCMMQVLLKVSRDANKPGRDNLVDICGYARNAEMIADSTEEL